MCPYCVPLEGDEDAPTRSIYYSFYLLSLSGPCSGTSGPGISGTTAQVLPAVQAFANSALR